MIFGNFVKNIKKAIKIVRNDGLMALFRGIRFKLATALTWRHGNVFRKISIKTKHVKATYRQKLVIFTGIPYDDIGGGQRSAQLTRAALRTGMQVMYVYAYPKYDVNKHVNVTSKVKISNLFHRNIKDLTVKNYLLFIDENSTVIFEFPHPLFVEYLEISRSRGIRTIFELIDDWSTSLGGNWFEEDVFKKFVLQADIVIGTSIALVRKLREMGRDEALYLPNAANEYIFDNTHSYKRPSDLPEGSVGLYFGSLYGEWFGWDYIKEAAEQNTNTNFCLIGNKPANIPVHFPENVHFLGEKKIDELPAYLSSADFGLIPFIPGKITDAVSPIKVFEYLFMAKPVVSTALAEVTDLPLISIARNESEFADLCQKLNNANGDIQTFKNIIDEFISQNSWFSRLQKITEIKGRQDVSVIILIHNNRNIIGRCLKSLIDNCSSYLADVIVVDNASEDGGGEYVVENFPTVRMIRNPMNGCSSGRNLGSKYPNGKYLAFFDSDQWFTSDFCFKEALSILESHAEIGAVGWSAGWLDLSVENLGAPIVDNFPHRAMNKEASIKGYRTDVAYLGTDGLFIPRTVFEATGGFDTEYDPTSFEDTDLSFAVKRLGFEIAYRDLTSIRHEAHQTTRASKDSPEYMELFTRNSKYFLNKWKDYKHYFIKY
jgi:GT2 family glycosyltransferase/glycosyltransferase involved in cell wall biosynthesis